MKDNDVKQVFLHIGTHKTGSTSIQRFLADAGSVLAEQGVLYPRSGRPDTDWSDQFGQHKLYWSVVGKRGVGSDQVWHDLREEVDTFSGDKVVLSAKGFDGLDTEGVRQVLGYMSPYPIHVIVYLRRPLQFLVSAYKQRVKNGSYYASFSHFVEEMVPKCDYLSLVSRWNQFDSVKSVDIKLFDKVRKEPGLEVSFGDAVDIDFEKVQSFVGPPVNTSPPVDLIQLVRWINVVETLLGKNKTGRMLANRARNNILGQRQPGKYIARTVRPFLKNRRPCRPGRAAPERRGRGSCSARGTGSW